MGNKPSAETITACVDRILNYTLSLRRDGISVCDGFGGAFGPFRSVNDAKLHCLGLIIADKFSGEQIRKGYCVDPHDYIEVGRQALIHRDINPDGTLN